MTTLKIGVASFPDLKARTLAVVGGTRKLRRSEPKLWFTSMEGLAKALSPANLRLLQIIAERRPNSLSELAELSGRAPANLSRTMRTMERYRLVNCEKDKAGRMRIRVPYRQVKVEIAIAPASTKRARTEPMHQARDMSRRDRPAIDHGPAPLRSRAGLVRSSRPHRQRPKVRAELG